MHADPKVPIRHFMLTLTGSAFLVAALFGASPMPGASLEPAHAPTGGTSLTPSPGGTTARPASPVQDFEVSSEYLATREGTRLAADVFLPADREAEQKFPALLVLTRYWRSVEHPTTGEPLPSLNALDQYFLEHGYAIVKVDVRGTGASFGTRGAEYSEEEVRDGYDVVEWVIKQPWSDGGVGAFGTSYTGTTAELLAAVEHPAVKAVVPGWSDFDIYVSPVRPYGLVASSFIQEWSTYVGWQDDNAVEQLGASVRRVDADTEGSMLAAAIEEHRANPEVFEVVRTAEYRDDEVDDVAIYDLGPLRWKDSIERSGVPMLVLVSWLDAGTIDGAVRRFRHFSNPQKLVIMATNHGGGSHASPFAVAGEPAPPTPTTEEQFEIRLEFLDHYLKGAENGIEAWPAIRYYNLGEEAFRTSEVWPVEGRRLQRFYLGESSGLDAEAPTAETGSDDYQVDFSVTTGTNNRWMTQMGAPVLELDDRGEMDARMLTYTSEPLEEDLQVTGTPVVSLWVASDHSDGSFFVYLEDVDEEGRSRYITEGGLRALHRKPWKDPIFGDDGFLHSFERADSTPLVPGEVAELTFRMWATSVLFRKGHRIRIAIAGADADTFDRLPAEGTPEITVYRSLVHPSFVELPVIR